MEEKEINVLDAKLGNLVVSVFEFRDKLLEQMDVQYAMINNLRKAYSCKGLTYSNYVDKLLAPIQIRMMETQNDAPIFEQYEQTLKEFEQLLGQLKHKDNSIEILNQSEQLINDLFILLNFQLDFLISKMSPIVTQVRHAKDAELELIAQYEDRKSSFIDNPLGKKIIEVYGLQQQQLIADQIELFLSDKEIMDEMQVVCDERERLLNISTELFLR